MYNPRGINFRSVFDFLAPVSGTPRPYQVLVPLLSGLFLLGLTAYALYDRGDDNIVFAPTSALSYISLGLFIICLVLGMISDLLYFTLLVFILLAFPAPVNDFWPAIFLGHWREAGAAAFPFFTHIDIYLIAGLVKGVLRNSRVKTLSSNLPLVVIVCVLISVAVNFFAESTRYERLLLMQGTYQLRYLIELLLLLCLCDIAKYRNHLLIGFVISVGFLFVEALAFTLASRLKALESGSLGNNAYASIVASILLFFFVIKRNYTFSPLYRRMISLGMIIAVISVLGTGARMAVLALVVTYFIYRIIRDWARTSLKKRLAIALSIVAFAGVVSLAANFLPHRYNPEVIYQRIHFKGFSTDIFEMVEIEPSWETSSLMTRQKLYATSVNMFRYHPVAGIGVGRWNYHKKEYGFGLFVLIDAHNGYLAILSQYGLLGLPMIIFLFIYPWVILARFKGVRPSNYLFWLGLINVFVSISELSNAGIFKHQIFGLLALNVLILMTLVSNNEENVSAEEPLTK